MPLAEEKKWSYFLINQPDIGVTNNHKKFWRNYEIVLNLKKLFLKNLGEAHFELNPQH